jgi:myo-inositol-1(or 4)-monophosphatase
MIQEQYPDHRILSEETYTDKSQAKDLSLPIWIIDPIDGTVNYAHGHFMVAVSIAFAVKVWCTILFLMKPIQALLAKVVF